MLSLKRNLGTLIVLLVVVIGTGAYIYRYSSPELRSYRKVLAVPDPTSAPELADDFERQFPASPLTEKLYLNVMRRLVIETQNLNKKTDSNFNPREILRRLELAEQMGDKALRIDPDSADTLAQSAIVASARMINSKAWGMDDLFVSATNGTIILTSATHGPIIIVKSRAERAIELLQTQPRSETSAGLIAMASYAAGAADERLGYWVSAKQHFETVLQFLSKPRNIDPVWIQAASLEAENYHFDSEDRAGTDSLRV